MPQQPTEPLVAFHIDRTQIRVEAGRLLASGLVCRDTAAAKKVVASARNGFPWQASIGAAVEEFEFLKENQTTVVNGRDLAGPLNVIRKATLGEISFVDLGADSQTSASVAASASDIDLMPPTYLTHFATRLRARRPCLHGKTISSWPRGTQATRPR
jgi:hypothetical protein